MARLVVTGGMGFIGSCLVRRRLATGKDEVVVVDKLTYAGNPNNLKEYKDDRNLTFVQGAGPAHAEKSLRRLEGRSGPTGFLLLHDIRVAGRDFALRQQLRTVPTPGEADPVVRDERVRGHASPGLRDGSEYPGLGPRRRSLRRFGSSPGGRRGPG